MEENLDGGYNLDPDSSDPNPFRYCGEYYDKETGSIYLRARYYNPRTGRFGAADTHWNPSNMIYGDNPILIDERQDPLGLNVYTYVPNIDAIRQSSGLYAYCMNNPIFYQDSSGNSVIAAASFAAANWWNPVGWVAGGVLAFCGGVYVGTKIADAINESRKSKNNTKPKDKDNRLRGEPGSINKEGTSETKIGPDGRAEKERHNTDHGKPKYHTNPHDHDIDWTPEGNPHFGEPINYPNGAPPFNVVIPKVIPRKIPGVVPKTHRSEAK